MSKFDIENALAMNIANYIAKVDCRHLDIVADILKHCDNANYAPDDATDDERDAALALKDAIAVMYR